MKNWSTSTVTIALVLLIQLAQLTSADYGKSGGDADWDSDPITIVSTSNDDIKQSYGGAPLAPAATTPAPLAAPVVAPVSGSIVDPDDDDSDDDDDNGSTGGAYGGGGDDDDDDDPVATQAPAPVAAPVVALAPAPVVTPAPPTSAPPATTSDDDNDDGDGDDDDDDGDDDDGDDENVYSSTGTTVGKQYEQTDPYSGGKQTSPSENTPQQQTDTTSVDSKPNVHNGGVNLYPYTQEIRDYIVETHNWARGALVPTSAANMRQLTWDESLAIEASELVNTCIFEHDTENYAYGQNLMYGGNSLDKTMVSGWMDGWVKSELSSYDRSGTGYMDLDHASAVLWANSYLVGCASKMCSKGYLTACNYYTPGNWQGERAYIPGPSCSQCPAKAPYCDATGKLCTADPTGATPTSKPAPAATPASSTSAPVPVVTPAKTTAAPAAAVPPAPTPAKSTPLGGDKVIPIYGPKVTPSPTPQLTIPHELCV